MSNESRRGWTRTKRNTEVKWKDNVKLEFGSQLWTATQRRILQTTKMKRGKRRWMCMTWGGSVKLFVCYKFCTSIVNAVHHLSIYFTVACIPEQRRISVNKNLLISPRTAYIAAICMSVAIVVFALLSHNFTKCRWVGQSILIRLSGSIVMILLSGYQNNAWIVVKRYDTICPQIYIESHLNWLVLYTVLFLLKNRHT